MPVQLEIVTPEKRVAAVEVDEVIAPGASGLFGVRLGHAPFLSAMRPGELTYFVGGKPTRYAIGGGFVQVENDQVRVLADTAESAEEIDRERARRAREDAAQRLKGKSEDDPEFAVQQVRLERAIVRLQVAEKER